MKEYGTRTFGELNAGRYDAMYEELMRAETGISVETLDELAGGGKVLELAIGTGRVALPLAARGLTVHGKRHLRFDLPGVQYDFQLDDPGSAGVLLPKRRTAPEQ